MPNELTAWDDVTGFKTCDSDIYVGYSCLADANGFVTNITSTIHASQSCGDAPQQISLVPLELYPTAVECQPIDGSTTYMVGCNASTNEFLWFVYTSLDCTGELAPGYPMVRVVL